jgi:hypothetical protein
MRKSLLLLSAAAVGLALPAMAQDATTLSPPSPNASQNMPQPSNSLPAGGATATQALPGDVNTPPAGTAAAGSDQGDMTGMQPMRHPHHRMSMAHHHMMNRHTGEITPATGSGPGEPESRHASNIDRVNTRSDIAPALPMPPVRGNSPEAYLAAADRALARHQTGEAQEALERAETRLLDRSVPAGQGNMAESDPLLTQIRDARMALAHRDVSAARNSIQQAMNMHMAQPAMGSSGMAQPAMGSPGMTPQPGMAPPPGMAPQSGMAPPPGMDEGTTGTPSGMQPLSPPPGTGVPQ